MTDPKDMTRLVDRLDQAVSGLEQCCVASFAPNGVTIRTADLRALLEEVGRYREAFAVLKASNDETIAKLDAALQGSVDRLNGEPG